jgi:hypothetical protein
MGVSPNVGGTNSPKMTFSPKSMSNGASKYSHSRVLFEVILARSFPTDSYKQLRTMTSTGTETNYALGIYQSCAVVINHDLVTNFIILIWVPNGHSYCWASLDMKSGHNEISLKGTCSSKMG